ncbi:MAG: GTP-binding protein [Promethearchaeota archaeon]|nr:MAG: GTP-binding protein [Candidatus Lokiarchaeota archaeon]
MKKQISTKKSYIYKVCIVGDGGVGKTSMVLRYCENSFKENYIMTIGSNFSTKSVNLDNHPDIGVKLQLWDLAGQKHFSFVRPPFYRGASGIIYVFDLTRRSSFKNIPEWCDEVEKVIGRKASVLVGNKLDIANQGRREIGKKDGEALMAELGSAAYFETSAKTGIAVEQVFKDVTRAVLRSANKI